MSRTIAVADIGGTHARFAMAEVTEGRVASLGKALTLRTVEHDGLEAAWAEFERLAGTRLPDALALAIAAPVGTETLRLTNSQWVIQPDLLPEQLGIAEAMIVNDFGAVAHAVAGLGPNQFEHVCGPDVPLPEPGTITVIGPGTGLGVAQLLRTASGYQVTETEGGHIDFPPLDHVEDQILAELRGRFGRVSMERVVSGPGLVNLYGAMAAIVGQEASIADNAAIWDAALAGTDPLAVSALDRFFRSFGAFAGDLALAHGSKAVVIAGGLGYRLKQHLRASGFSGRFVAKGRFHERMEAITVKLLDHPQPGLYGAAAAYAKEHR